MEKKRILLILGIAMCTICIIKISTHKMHENSIKKNEGRDLNENVKTVNDTNKVSDDKSKESDDKSKENDDKSKENDDKSKENEKTTKKRRRNKRKRINGINKIKADEENSNGKPVEKKAKISNENAVEKKVKNENSVKNADNKKVMANSNSVENKAKEKKPAKSKANKKNKRKSKQKMKNQHEDLIKIRNEPDKFNENELDKLISDQGEDIKIWLRDKQNCNFKPPVPPKPRNYSSPTVYFLPENPVKMDFLDSCFRPEETFSSFKQPETNPKKTQDLSQILKCIPEVVNSMFDVHDYAIHCFAKIFTKNPEKLIKNVENKLKNYSICFYRRGDRENDILSFFVFIARTDKESLNKDVRLQSIYKNLMMIYAGKYLQTLNFKDLTQTENELEIESEIDSFTDSDSEEDPVKPQKYSIKLPKHSAIDQNFLLTNFEVLLSEFSGILDDISEESVPFFENLLNFLNCFYVRLKPRIDEYDDRDLKEIYKCMLKHLKIAVNKPENERKKILGSGFY